MNDADLVPSPSDSKVLALCSTICPGKPMLVPVKPEPGALQRMCFQNVERKVQAEGGSTVYGWNILQTRLIYLEATFHAVWRSPKGQLICLSPRDRKLDHILFLKDETRTHIDKGALPRRSSLSKNTPLVQELWSLFQRFAKIHNPPMNQYLIICPVEVPQ